MLCKATQFRQPHSHKRAAKQDFSRVRFYTFFFDCLSERPWYPVQLPTASPKGTMPAQIQVCTKSISSWISKHGESPKRDKNSEVAGSLQTGRAEKKASEWERERERERERKREVLCNTTFHKVVPTEAYNIKGPDSTPQANLQALPGMGLRFF